jgi:predicted NACHT family NTPase
MMKEGTQTISRPGLERALKDARRPLPEVLGFSTLRDSEFIERVEFRSSLLVETGKSIVSGRLVPIYQFQHLTFQEYLTARAIIDENHEDRVTHDSTFNTIKPYILDDNWREIIPLLVSLSGKNSTRIVESILDQYDTERSLSDSINVEPYFELISELLVDEVQVSPDIIDRALSTLIYPSDGDDSYLSVRHNDVEGGSI